MTRPGKLPFTFARNLYSYDDLIDMQEIARITGYSYWYIRALASETKNVTRKLPEPVTDIGRTKLWLRPEIEAWHEAFKKEKK